MLSSSSMSRSLKEITNLIHQYCLHYNADIQLQLETDNNPLK